MPFKIYLNGQLLAQVAAVPANRLDECITNTWLGYKFSIKFRCRSISTYEQSAL